jgi:hypothetical protein
MAMSFSPSGADTAPPVSPRGEEKLHESRHVFRKHAVASMVMRKNGDQRTHALKMMSARRGATHHFLRAHGISERVLFKLVAGGLAYVETRVLVRPRGLRIMRYYLSDAGRAFLAEAVAEPQRS